MLRNVDNGFWYQRTLVKPASRAQVQRYFPETTDIDADAFIARFGDEDVAEVELKRIERELLEVGYSDISEEMASKLRRLARWQGEPSERVYHEGRLVGFKMDIDLGARQSGFPVRTKFNAVVALTLRAGEHLFSYHLSAQFPNIESLTVVGLPSTRPFNNSASRLNIELGFVLELEKLPRLRELNLQNCILPAGFSLTSMTELRALALGNIQGMTDLNAVVNGLPGRLSLQVLDLQRNASLKVAPDVTGMAGLRVLDLTQTGIEQLPLGLDADNGPLRLEVLKLGDNALSAMPSLKVRTALQELDLSSTGLDRFPEGVTSDNPGKVLNLSNNRITSIPESVEIRAGFNLMGNPITDLATLRRLRDARIKTGIDIWLGKRSTDSSPNAWLRHLPLEELSENLNVWNSYGHSLSGVRQIVWDLARTPEFHVERPLLQQRVWQFFERYRKAEPGVKARLESILWNEPSPLKKLERLEAETGLSSEPLPADPVQRSDTGSDVGHLLDAAEPTTRAQVRKYFPDVTDQQADHFRVHFGDKDAAEVELKRLQLGLAQLDSKLRLWTSSSGFYGNELGPTLRRLYTWQGEPDELVFHDKRPVGFKLSSTLSVWPDHWALPTPFNSVVSLELSGLRMPLPEGFLSAFPNLESLGVVFGYGMTSDNPGLRLTVEPGNIEGLARLARLRELKLQRANLSPDFSVAGMTGLRLLDLEQNGLTHLPGLNADNGPLRLEVLKLSHNRLSVAPSVKGMTALKELDLSNSGIDRFPEGITNEIPGKVLNLANNRITSIPESVELRAGFNLIGNPITDPASHRRLIHARIKIGIDIWLGDASHDRSANLWLRNVPPGKELTEKLKLWDSFGPDSRLLDAIRQLSRTPEFHVEYLLLQRRVWSFLKIYGERGSGEQARLDNILLTERSPGKMLDRLEAEIREYDSGRQNPPLHHLPKRPRLDP
ncbi:leucine-rich repeat domain-containing protein [Pseudomonas sp. NPDC085632]|uniref:leucine-rich repeat domain-containing protein n=1 Tax=Pseudomonas sp. NPDC085632 TaxID=3364429 RepID=UPI0037C5C72C